VSRLLPAEEAALYREWIANRRRLDALLAEMRQLSRQATEYEAEQAGFTFRGPDRPRRRGRSAG